MCSLSFRLASSSVTSVSHQSSNVQITPIFWCNGWCEEKFRYCMVCIPSQHTYSGPRTGRGRQTYRSNIGIRLRADVSFVRRLNIGPRAANLSGQHRHPPAGRCSFFHRANIGIPLRADIGFVLRLNISPRMAHI